MTSPKSNQGTDELQQGYSQLNPGAVFDLKSRQRKAKTVERILRDHLGDTLKERHALGIGVAGGIVDAWLARFFKQFVGIDIDLPALLHAHKTFANPDLSFLCGDAQHLPFADQSFDCVICTHVYEHVPSAKRLMSEVHRVLKPGGICYFAAGNRLQYMEPHYELPMLSVMPRFMGHWYLRLRKRGDYYYEKHQTLWGLKRLTDRFQRIDYTCRIINDPDAFSCRYMLPKNSRKLTLAKFICRWLYFLIPTYIWVLVRPNNNDHSS